jgi:hypothetical protein
MPIPVSRTVQRNQKCIGLGLPGGRRGQGVRGDGDLAALGELDRVADQIEQDLTEADAIAMQPFRCMVEIHQDVELLGLNLIGDQIEDVIDHARRFEVTGFECQLLGLDLGQIQDIVDDLEQMLGRVAEPVQLLDLAWRERILSHEMRIADDGVHRGADLVAHVRQEGAFGAIGALGSGLGRFQLGGADGDQFLQMPTIGLQFACRLHTLGDVLNDAQRIERLARIIERQFSAFLDPADALGGLNAVSDPVGGARKRLVPTLDDAVAVFGMDAVQKAAQCQRCAGRQTEDTIGLVRPDQPVEREMSRCQCPVRETAWARLRMS